MPNCPKCDKPVYFVSGQNDNDNDKEMIINNSQERPDTDTFTNCYRKGNYCIDRDKQGRVQAEILPFTVEKTKLDQSNSSQAERKTSLGKDWHGSCLRCEKCNKTLVPGGHSEHDGKPYCNNPCYSALFGPGGFGRGGAQSYIYNK